MDGNLEGARFLVAHGAIKELDTASKKELLSVTPSDCFASGMAEPVRRLLFDKPFSSLTNGA